MMLGFTLFTLATLILWVAWIIVRFERLKHAQEVFHEQVNTLVTAIYQDEPELWLKPRDAKADSLVERWDVGE